MTDMTAEEIVYKLREILAVEIFQLDYTSYADIMFKAADLIETLQAENKELKDADEEIREPAVNTAFSLKALQEKIQREENTSLTVEYLKEINRDMNNRRWVWIEVLKSFDYKMKISAYYQVQNNYIKDDSFCCGYPGLGFGFDYCDYGKTWLAYRYKPKREE